MKTAKELQEIKNKKIRDYVENEMMPVIEKKLLNDEDADFAFPQFKGYRHPADDDALRPYTRILEEAGFVVGRYNEGNCAWESIPHIKVYSI